MMQSHTLISTLKTRIADLASKTYVDSPLFSAKQEVNTIIEIFNKLTADLEACQERQKAQLRTTDQLELLNNEMETFSYSVSHELKAPLRGLHVFANALQEEYRDKLDEKGVHYLNKIMKHTLRMRLLIDELLDFSQLGRQELSKTSVDMDILVNEVAQEISLSYPHKTNLVKQPLGKATGDYSMLKQVYHNLLLNAIKYSSKKETPEVETGVSENNKEKVYYVKDNGAGFDMEYYDKLFTVFQRLHNPSEFEGLGVGLAIVQRIILKHGGKVWAEGRLNEGATFYFTLGSEAS